VLAFDDGVALELLVVEAPWIFRVENTSRIGCGSRAVDAARRGGAMREDMLGLRLMKATLLGLVLMLLGLSGEIGVVAVEHAVVHDAHGMLLRLLLILGVHWFPSRHLRLLRRP